MSTRQARLTPGHLYVAPLRLSSLVFTKRTRIQGSSFNVGAKATGQRFSKAIAGPPTAKPIPKDKKPDWVVRDQTTPEQAIIYRLTADYNPLHIGSYMIHFFILKVYLLRLASRPQHRPRNRIRRCHSPRSIYIRFRRTRRPLPSGRQRRQCTEVLRRALHEPRSSRRRS